MNHDISFSQKGLGRVQEWLAIVPPWQWPSELFKHEKISLQRTAAFHLPNFFTIPERTSAKMHTETSLKASPSSFKLCPAQAPVSVSLWKGCLNPMKWEIPRNKHKMCGLTAQTRLRRDFWWGFFCLFVCFLKNFTSMILEAEEIFLGEQKALSFLEHYHHILGKK